MDSGYYILLGLIIVPALFLCLYNGYKEKKHEEMLEKIDKEIDRHLRNGKRDDVFQLNFFNGLPVEVRIHNDDLEIVPDYSRLIYYQNRVIDIPTFIRIPIEKIESIERNRSLTGDNIENFSIASQSNNSSLTILEYWEDNDSVTKKLAFYYEDYRAFRIFFPDRPSLFIDEKLDNLIDMADNMINSPDSVHFKPRKRTYM